MKSIRMLGLAVVTALAMIALAGVGTASARTVLCSAPETVCAEKNRMPAPSYTYGDHSEESDNQFTVKAASGWTFACTQVTIGAGTTAVDGNPLPAKGEHLGPTKCNYGSWSCSKASITDAPATIQATEGGSGTITLGSAESHWKVSFTCKVFNLEDVTCTFGAAKVPLTVSAASNLVSANEVPLALESGDAWMCGKSGLLSVSLDRGGSYISKRPYTVLCSVNETPCAPGHILPAGEEFGGAVYYEGTSFTVGTFFKCGNAFLGGTTTASEGDPLAATPISYLSQCTWGTQPCTAELTAQSTTIAATGSGNGTLSFLGGAEPVNLTFTCTIGKEIQKCVWTVSQIPFQVDRKAETMVAQKVILTMKSGLSIFCGNSPELNVSASTSMTGGQYISTD